VGWGFDARHRPPQRWQAGFAALAIGALEIILCGSPQGLPGQRLEDINPSSVEEPDG
jgi:hypothetical protein